MMTDEEWAQEHAKYDCANGRHRWITRTGERRHTCGECGLDAVDAVVEEREACATVAETVAAKVTNPYFFEKNGYKNACEAIAAAIRARK